MKKIIILIAALVVVGIAAFIFFGRSNGGNSQPAPQEGSTGGIGAPNQQITGGTGSFPNAPQGDTFVFGTAHGLVTIKNFYKIPPTIDEEFLILANTADYEITYDTENGQFFIYAASTPLEVARQKGEAAFLQILGISQQDACKFNVAEGFPPSSDKGNTQPGLSFCAGGAFQAK